jgi:hypothetical protein
MEIKVNIAELETILGALSDHRRHVYRHGYELGLAGNQKGSEQCDKVESNILNLERRLRDVRMANVQTYK